MATAAHIAYALAIAVFFGLSVGFGAVALFPDPEFPVVRTDPFQRDDPPLTPEQQRERFEEEQRIYDAYREDLDSHRRNQLIGIAIVSAVAVIAGIAVAVLPAALRLGAILGGLGTVIWGVTYSHDHVSDGAVFALVLVIFLLLASLSLPAMRARLRGLIRLTDTDSLLRRDDADPS